ncbi:unnamed protein product [Adineta ricciae]|uniref:G-protein coupled receptors family 1 profile domain-containing protein n=1 Tax=Adineta ricciae TaxID=249248 RepID=A0A816EIW9_ADIRI|nr:unnamed protein product [Adineta ricciae]CAF1648541.1 unnamed protein product [Adineta ricciae]
MSSQSSNANLIIQLGIIQRNLSKSVVLVLLILGTIGSLLGLMVFSRKTFRKNPCSMYMIAYYLGNLTYIHIIIIQAVLYYGYDIMISSQNIHSCRVSLYMSIVLTVLCSCYLILASVDRILITSRNAIIRQRSTRRLAFISIISLTLFWLICHIHVLIFSTILQSAPGYFVCYAQLGTYLSVLSYYMTSNAVLSPLILACLGILAARNVSQIGKNQVHIVASNDGISSNGISQRLRSKDHQLIRVVLTDVLLYFISSFPLSIMVLYQQISQYNIKTFEQTQIDSFIQYTCAVFGYIPYCMSFYINLLISKTFRNEVKSIFLFYKS